MKIEQNKLPKGLLHPTAGEKKFTLKRFCPSSDLGYFIQHYWIVRWNLPDQTSHLQTLIAYPNVNLVFEKQRTRIYGVAKSISTHLLEGCGWVIGIKFKPGGFYPFFQKPVSELTDRSLCVEEVFESNSASLEEAILSQPDDEQMVSQVEAFMLEHLPERDANVELVSNLVSTIQNDRTISKVEDVVRITGINKRMLQRLFDRYVGVGPKSVIQRYRLHEAAALID